MLIFFENHPVVGNSYQFRNMFTGETVTRTIQQRLKQWRYSDVFRVRQQYFEVVMIDTDGEIVTAEYEINT